MINPLAFTKKVFLHLCNGNENYFKDCRFEEYKKKLDNPLLLVDMGIMSAVDAFNLTWCSMQTSEGHSLFLVYE